ncbi:unnamed protein product [[Actinomadura] parvosata subsp. kistnae]|nr:unnamed protein product [Actinomadura parvosata subsp. kistnae]
MSHHNPSSCDRGSGPPPTRCVRGRGAAVAIPRYAESSGRVRPDVEACVPATGCDAVSRVPGGVRDAGSQGSLARSSSVQEAEHGLRHDEVGSGVAGHRCPDRHIGLRRRERR